MDGDPLAGIGTVDHPVDTDEDDDPPGDPERPAYPFDFSLDVPANTGKTSPKTVDIEIPFDGRILSLTVIWPPGAENRVGIKLRRDPGEKLFPRDDESEYVAADDFGTTFALRETVGRNDELVAEYVNNDTQHPHFITAIAEIEQRGPRRPE